MNKKEYIKPIVKQIIISNEALLAGSQDVISADFGGDDDPDIPHEAEAKRCLTWEDDYRLEGF